MARTVGRTDHAAVASSGAGTAAVAGLERDAYTSPMVPDPVLAPAPEARVTAGSAELGRTASPVGHTASPVGRRTLLTGTGSGLTALALAACTDDAGTQEPEPDSDPEPGAGSELSVTYAEDPNSRGDWTVWSVSYDLAEGQEAPALFDATIQALRHEALEAKKAEQQWTAADPLLVLDPYGTTASGLYVYLEDAATGSLDFTVTAAATQDFTRTAANHAATGFEGLVVGLIPATHNTLSLTWAPQGGEPAEGQLQIMAPATDSGYPTTIAADVTDPGALAPGLFALSGVAGLSHHTYLFDDTGVMRAELRSGSSPAHRFQIVGGTLVMTTGAYQVSVIDPLGHAATSIDLGDHSVHHDLEVLDGMAYVLTSHSGSERVEDRVIRVDLASGDVTEVVDLQKVFPAYEEIAHVQGDGTVEGDETTTGKDWTHINSLDVVDGIMYLSTRETSTIIALDGALDPDTETTARWLIGVEELWEGTGYADLFLAPEGAVTGIAGQHTVHRIDDDALPEGQYYLEIFNNNHWRLSTRDEVDWLEAGPANAFTDEVDGVSHVLRYLVDENAGTFRDDLVIEVPYSSVVSNVYRLGDGGIDQPMVVNSGRAFEFSERDADGNVLASYRYEAQPLGYRVYKESLEGFWFSVR